MDFLRLLHQRDRLHRLGVWDYVCLSFVSSVVSLKLYTLINFSWNQYTDDLPEYPHHQDDLPLNIVLPQPPRPPSVVSYFKFAGGDD